jgi:uncharacterized protein YjfI (DUF2170 family)|tara:strand:+ start:360 stop:560 length:201 start_codon:yes stop_codon:yes gene_type:complete
VDQVLVVQIEQVLVVRAQEFVDKEIQVVIQNQIHQVITTTLVVAEVESVEQEQTEIVQLQEQVEQD